MTQEWASIITALIGSGALTGAITIIYQLGDKKTTQVLTNLSKTVDQWRDLLAEAQKELANERSERRQERADYEEKLLAKDRKIDSQYKEMSVLRDKNDKLSSKQAIMSIIKCWDFPCPKREPPMKKTAQKDIEDSKKIEELIKIDENG